MLQSSNLRRFGNAYEISMVRRSWTRTFFTMRNLLEVSGDIIEGVDPIFFSDPLTAAMKALGLT